MRAYAAFTKKEFMEGIRTYKVFVMGIVFLLFGMMNPLVAKFTPELLEALAPEMNLSMPEPTAMDSWMQFFKNVGQMGLVVLVIVFSGTMGNEISRGTLVNVLTKGLRRSVVVLAKFTASVVVWTFCYGICFGVSYAYTAYFWEMDGISEMFLGISGLWLFGVFLISVVICGGVLLGKGYGSLLFCGGVVVAMLLVNVIPKLGRYNPITLAGSNAALLSGEIKVGDFLPAVVVCFGLTMLLLLISVWVFDRKQI